jgi:hypothetical protein
MLRSRWLQAAETAIKDAGSRVIAVPADVAHASDMERLRDTVLGRPLGRR